MYRLIYWDLMAQSPFTPVALTGVFPFAAK